MNRRQLLALAVAALPGVAVARSERPQIVCLRNDSTYVGVIVNPRSVTSGLQDKPGHVYVIWFRRTDGRFCNAGWYEPGALVADGVAENVGNH